MADILKPNRVRELLKQGKIVVGLRSFTTHPAFIEIMGWTGFDFVSIDTEHSPADAGATLPAIQACELTGATPLVRVYEISAPLICKVLDNGARGVMVPHVSTASQAEAVVRAVKFPPLGERSACPNTRSNHFGLLSLSSLKEYYQKANEDTLVMLSIEDVEGIRNLPDILKVKGIDVIGLGRGDLSHSMGIPGETYENPKLYGALKDLVKMCSAVGVPVMTPAGSFSPSDASYAYTRKIVDAGVRVLYLASDLSLFGRACQELIKIREVL
jgi:4-hydroxy-2-oxoheptanedioate aldolase